MENLYYVIHGHAPSNLGLMVKTDWDMIQAACDLMPKTFEEVAGIAVISGEDEEIVFERELARDEQLEIAVNYFQESETWEIFPFDEKNEFVDRCEHYGLERERNKLLYGADGYTPEQLTNAILSGRSPDGWIACHPADSHSDTPDMCYPDEDDCMLDLYAEHQREGFTGTEADFQVHVLTGIGVSEEAARKYVEGWD